MGGEMDDGHKGGCSQGFVGERRPGGVCAGASGPPDRPHQFVYYITIHNDSPHAVTVTGRIVS